MTAPLHAQGEPTKEEIERYKKEWKENGFPDIAFGDPMEHHRVIPVQEFSGEHALWGAFFEQLRDDYTGEGFRADRECLECTSRTRCKCPRTPFLQMVDRPPSW